MTNPLKVLAKSGVLALTGSEPFAIRACMKYARDHNAPLLVEATVNQVNQFGGYTGMRAKDYAALLIGLAKKQSFPVEKIILCGDHLGPFIWQDLPEKEAMARSRELVREYVAAGFRKIHLDPTMRLADDDRSKPLSLDTIARRVVELAKVSEETYDETADDTPWKYRPAYVIGSEVPTPGGTEEDEGMQVTKPRDLLDSLDGFKKAFLENGLEAVWEDMVGVVAQIGVEFSDDSVHDYNHEAALPLAEALAKHYPNLVFESHSSDYQTPECLFNMVKDRVGILKVGPGLTFAMREGLFAVAMMEKELQPIHRFAVSNFIEVLERVMLTSTPNYWEKYYHGAPEELAFKRKYSFSDRSRYYFAHPEVLAAREKMLATMDGVTIPLSLIAQYMPVQFDRIRSGTLQNKATLLVEDKITDIMNRYYTAIRRANG